MIYKQTTNQSNCRLVARRVFLQKDCCSVDRTHRRIHLQVQSELVLVDQTHPAMLQNLWLGARRTGWYRFALLEDDLYLGQLS